MMSLDEDECPETAELQGNVSELEEAKAKL
jgi:hypothetical protein